MAAYEIRNKTYFIGVCNYLAITIYEILSEKVDLKEVQRLNLTSPLTSKLVLTYNKIGEYFLYFCAGEIYKISKSLDLVLYYFDLKNTSSVCVYEPT